MGNESGYGSEPGYRGDAEFGYGDEFDDEEEDVKPLFWEACRNRSCETPLEVISSELIASELMIPSSLVKPLLFPGAIAKSLIAGSKLPTYHHLFIFYSFHDLNHGASFSSDFHHLEVFAGSCLCLVGALLNLFKPTRISFIGTLLIYLGLSYQRHSSLRLCSSQKLWPTLFTHTAIECLNMNSKATKGGRRVIARRIAKGRHKVTT